MSLPYIYTPTNSDVFIFGDSKSASSRSLDLTRVDGALSSDSSGIDSCYGVTSVSKGPEATPPGTGSQLRSVTVIQVGAATPTNYADVKNSVNHRLALFATGSAISYAKQKLSLRMTQPAYQYTQSQSATNSSNIEFGETDALTFAAVANEFQRQKFQAGAVMSTYRGNAALQMVVLPSAAGDPDENSWGDQAVWRPTSGCQFDSIKGWDDDSEAVFVGEKEWIAAFDYQYYDGSHVTLNLGRYGTTTIGTSDEGQYATEELYFAQKNEEVAGSKWGMLQDGKWPRVSTRQNDSGPTVTISGGGGSGATATATCGTEGTVTSITVTNGGSGYFTAPDVEISGGGGSGAEATATLSGNTVGSITIGPPGSGYTPVPAVRKSDSKTWYAADINSDTSAKYSHTVSYGDEKMQIALSGLVVNDAIRQSGISQTSDNDVLDAITPLNCYANLQLGDSYSFPVGNSFNFNNHAANMGIHVGRSATFNIWSTDPEKWDLSESPTSPKNWASLEKTLGDTYSYHWGNSRSYVETSDGANSIREGQGKVIEKFKSKRVIFNAATVTESSTVGFNSELESRLFDFSNSSIGEKYVSSAAEYGINMDISTGPGVQGELNVSGVNFVFKAPPPEALLGQVTWDVQAGTVSSSESLKMVLNKNDVKVCLLYVEEDVSGAEQRQTAAATDETVSLTTRIMNFLGLLSEAKVENEATVRGANAEAELLNVGAGAQSQADGTNGAVGGADIRGGSTTFHL